MVSFWDVFAVSETQLTSRNGARLDSYGDIVAA